MNFCPECGTKLDPDAKVDEATQRSQACALGLTYVFGFLVNSLTDQGERGRCLIETFLEILGKERPELNAMGKGMLAELRVGAELAAKHWDPSAPGVDKAS